MKKTLGLIGLIDALSLNSCRTEEKKDKVLAECQSGNIRIVAEYHTNPSTFWANDYYTLKFFETEPNVDGNMEEFYTGQIRARQTEAMKGLFFCYSANQAKRIVIDIPRNGIYTVYANRNR